MSEIRAPGGAGTTAGPLRLRRFRTAEIVEAVVIAVLLIATVVFGFQWNQATSSLSSTKATLTTTQSQLATVQSQLDTARSDLATAQNTVTVRQQIDAYASVYLKGTAEINGALGALTAAANSENVAEMQAAGTQLKTAVNNLHNQMASITVPSVLSAADKEFQQGLDLLVAGATSLESSLNAFDSNGVVSALNTLDQGWTHMAAGEDALLAVMSNPSAVL